MFGERKITYFTNNLISKRIYTQLRGNMRRRSLGEQFYIQLEGLCQFGRILLASGGTWYFKLNSLIKY